MDSVSPEKRSEIMSHIHGKNTTPEIAVRKYLFSKGFRFRIHVKKLPGTPDIVLPKYRTAIFINGCFWHSHDGCKIASTPKTRSEYWEAKFAKNKARDKKYEDELTKAGWHVLVLWECELSSKNPTRLDEVIEWLINSN